MAINLDDSIFDAPINPSQKDVTPTAASDSLELTLAVPPAIDFTKAAKPAPTLAEIYDQFLKRVYMFDISGSMNVPVVGSETIEMFDWRDSTLGAITERIEEAKAKETRLNEWVMEHQDDEDEDAPDLPSYMELSPLESVLCAAPDNLPSHLQTEEELLDAQRRLKEFIIERHLVLDLGISPKLGCKLETRMQLVQTVALKLIQDRYDKYPNADVAAIAFDTRATVLEAQPKEKLFEEIRNLHQRMGGGTSIDAAFDAAFALIKSQPSAMQMNHIVIVTDAEDQCSVYINDTARKRCAQFKITVDFIHVTKPFGDFDADTVDALVNLCKETNGEYTKVTTKAEFETKFIAAGTRLLLPPGSN
jgi:hypothetical protein